MAKSSNSNNRPAPGKDKGAATTEFKPDTKRAAELGKKLKLDELWENDKNEFFTSENLGLLSVDQDKKRLHKHLLSVTPAPTEEPGGEGGGGE